MQLLPRPWRFALAAILILAAAPASATMWKWSQTAATNSTADATINWAEGQAPSSVNDSARAMMAAVAKYRDDVSGVSTSNAILEVGGTATAYTLSSNQSLTSLTNGFTVTFRVGSGLTNTGTVTLAVDGLAAKGIQGVNGTNLDAGTLVVGSTYTVTYFATADVWLLHSFYFGNPGTPAGVIEAYAGTTAPSGYLLAAGQCESRATHAVLFAVIGTTYPGTGSCTGSEFGIPDLRGRAIAGQDDMGGTSANRLIDAGSDSLNGDTLGDTGGAETETLSSAELAAHTHTGPSHTHAGTTASDGSHSHTEEGVSGDFNAASGGNGVVQNDSSQSTGSSGSHDHTFTTGAGGTGATGSTGSGTAFAKVQPTIILNFIIKF